MPALKLPRRAPFPRPTADGVCPAQAAVVLRGDALLVLVYRQMSMLCGSHPDLDDLAQTAIEQVLRSRFEGRSKFSTFTYAVCYRVWLKHLRSFRRWLKYFELGGNDQFPCDVPFAASEVAELRQRVHRALDGIATKQRAVILLHDIEGLDVEDVALIVEANLATVRSRLRDGRKALARKLQHDPYFSDETYGRSNDAHPTK